MARYEKAPNDVREIVEKMTERYHPTLRDAGASICCLMAFPTEDKNGDSTGPALTHQGYPAQAVVKIIGLKERTDGRADAEICIDGENWPLLSEAEKNALIDHELEHLEPKYDKHGLLVRDDLDRPKLKIRKHDHQFGWFDSIVRRHGRAALEFMQFDRFQTQYYTERWLPFLDNPDTTPVVAPAEAAKAENAAAAPAASGIDSITFSSPGRQSVTLTKDSVKNFAKASKKRAFAGKPSSSRRKAAAGR
jgi:hypothetical protein